MPLWIEVAGVGAARCRPQLVIAIAGIPCPTEAIEAFDIGAATLAIPGLRERIGIFRIEHETLAIIHKRLTAQDNTSVLEGTVRRPFPGQIKKINVVASPETVLASQRIGMQDRGPGKP